MCLTSTSLWQARIYFLVTPNSVNTNEFNNRLSESAHYLLSAKKAIDSVEPTGVQHADQLANQLRQSINSAGPKISRLLNEGASGSSTQILDRIDQINQLLSNIRPGGSDLSTAAQADPNIGETFAKLGICHSLPQ
jgi:hypothetical protein